MRDTNDIETAPTVDVRPLRLVDNVNSAADHFCPLCDCFKSGWADQANPRGDWCTDPDCPCHDDELR